jgi:hypothetical protein
MTIETLNIENRVWRVARLAGPASYSTGGEAISAATFKLSRLDHLIVSAMSEGGYGVAYDPSAAKVKWMQGDYDPAAVGPFVEVPAATDLDAEVVDIIAIGLP